MSLCRGNSSQADNSAYDAFHGTIVCNSVLCTRDCQNRKPRVNVLDDMSDSNPYSASKA